MWQPEFPSAMHRQHKEGKEGIKLDGPKNTMRKTNNSNPPPRIEEIARQ